TPCSVRLQGFHFPHVDGQTWCLSPGPVHGIPRLCLFHLRNLLALFCRVSHDERTLCRVLYYFTNSTCFKRAPQFFLSLFPHFALFLVKTNTFHQEAELSPTIRELEFQCTPRPSNNHTFLCPQPGTHGGDIGFLQLQFLSNSLLYHP